MTDPESPGSPYLNRLLDCADEVEASLRSRSTALPPSILFGTLRSGRVHATTFTVEETDERIILIEAGLLAFLEAITGVLAELFMEGHSKSAFGTWIGLSEETYPFQVPPELSRHFDRVLEAYVVEGDVLGAGTRRVPAHAKDLHDWLRFGAEVFVIGHEYGHMVADLERIPSPAKVPDDGRPAWVGPWASEFLADMVGLGAAVTAFRSRGIDPRLSHVAASGFLWSIEALERALALLHQGHCFEAPQIDHDFFCIPTDPAAAFPDTHPPAAMRRGALQSALLSSSKEDSEIVAQYHRRMHWCVELLWKEIRPWWRKRHEHGVRPASLWN